MSESLHIERVTVRGLLEKVRGSIVAPHEVLEDGVGVANSTGHLVTVD